MLLQKIQVIYHPDPDDARTYLHDRAAGTLGLKLDTDLGQYGLWDFLPEPHTVGDVLTLLGQLTEKVRFGLLDLALVDGVGERMADVPGDQEVPALPGEKGDGLG